MVHKFSLLSVYYRQSLQMRFEELLDKFLIALHETPDKHVLLSCCEGTYVVDKKVHAWTLSVNDEFPMEVYRPASSTKYICQKVVGIKVGRGDVSVDIYTDSYILVFPEKSWGASWRYLENFV